MEFGEKLQQLRKSHGLTQEQLAQRLYVSRTAVSKWESGKGYPNLDSLRALSAEFSVSIDVLLSDGELLDFVAEENHRATCAAHRQAVCVIDLLAALLFVLPVFSRLVDGYYHAASLFGSDTSGWILLIDCLLLAALPVLGLAGLLLAKRENAAMLCRRCSLAVHVAAILQFTASRDPYPTMLLFALLLAKLYLLKKDT